MISQILHVFGSQEEMMKWLRFTAAQRSDDGQTVVAFTTKQVRCDGCFMQCVAVADVHDMESIRGMTPAYVIEHASFKPFPGWDVFIRSRVNRP